MAALIVRTNVKMLGTFVKAFCFSVWVGTLSAISHNQVQYHKKTASRDDHDIGGN